MTIPRDGIPGLVKELRKRLNLTQEQFAHEVGVAYSPVNHWENGKRIPQHFLNRRLREMKEKLDTGKKKAPTRRSSP